MTIREMGQRACEARVLLARAGGAVKRAALEAIAYALEENAGAIIAANAEDLAAGKANGMSPALLDRLALDEARIAGMAKGVREVAAEEDPVGQVRWGAVRPNGLRIEKITVPLGVIGVIFEARPNVCSDAAALCLMAGNACILRGGKEAINSNKAIAGVMRGALEKAGLPADCVQLVEDTSRQGAAEMMALTGLIDVLIPRGGAGLIRAVVENARVPVIETGAGNCHIYVDESADIAMAADIVFNAKTSRPSVCNAAESLLVHRDIAAKALPAIAARLAEKDVELRGDEAACSILPNAVPAMDEDWATEYGAYIMSVKVVDSLEAALSHIDRYSTHHSEAIITSDYASAERFLREVDSAAVYVNASTRFTDGGEFGFGAEIGISTQKLHARGPLGLANLVSEKYLVRGNGQIR
ncbi:MAG: glutamate-5-semialdehyde dehydrogenase [Clostridium sp.]|jgi:glutamate-5-semialdehyde dehydrogenase|nr:glutamate-5-semialdehyde dehydrogenase [Clostridium sp.]